MGARSLLESSSHRRRWIGATHRLVFLLGLAVKLDGALKLLKLHQRYHESDHVLDIAYNALAGGRPLEDLDLRRNDIGFLDALGGRCSPTQPPPATSAAASILSRSRRDAINETRLGVWRRQPRSFFGRDRANRCRHALVVSLANTGEPLFLMNPPAKRPSSEGVKPHFDYAHDPDTPAVGGEASS